MMREAGFGALGLFLSRQRALDGVNRRSRGTGVKSEGASLAADFGRAPGRPFKRRRGAERLASRVSFQSGDRQTWSLFVAKIQPNIRVFLRLALDKGVAGGVP